MRTLNQELAEKVYYKVDGFEKAHPKGSAERKQYGSMAHKLPILIRTAGLAEALSFVESRGKPAHQTLLKNLTEVVLDTEKGDLPAESRAHNTDLQKYMYLTRRSMLALKWFKRFAESVLEVEATDEGELND